MGNYVTCKNYTQKEKNLFRNFTSTHFSLIAKTYVAIGTCCLVDFSMRNHSCYHESLLLPMLFHWGN